MFSHVQANDHGTDYICGDIHGCFDVLEEKLREISFDKNKDRLFALGDLIDRGPASERAVEYLEKDWFFSLYGNHEDLMCKSVLCNAETYSWMGNGGIWSNGFSRQELKKMAMAFEILPRIIQLDLPDGKSVGLVHAEYPKDYSWSEAGNLLDNPVLIWGRGMIMHRDNWVVPGIDHIFHGHTISEEIQTLGNRTYLDLGCFDTGNLAVIDPVKFLKWWSA